MWFEQWRDKRPVRAHPVDWGMFMVVFLDNFFPLELREKDSVEFMNLRQL